MLRLQIGNIPPEKLQALYDISVKFGEQRAAIYSGLNNGPLLNADREKRWSPRSTRRCARSNGDLRLPRPRRTTSSCTAVPTANQLRQVLGPAAADRGRVPRDLSAVPGLPRTVSGRAVTNLPPDQTAARKLAEDQMNNQIKGLLGRTQRGRLCSRPSNPTYTQTQPTRRPTRPPALPPRRRSAAVQTDIQQRATDVRNDNTLSRADRNTQLAVARGGSRHEKLPRRSGPTASKPTRLTAASGCRIWCPGRRPSRSTSWPSLLYICGRGALTPIMNSVRWPRYAEWGLRP